MAVLQGKVAIITGASSGIGILASLVDEIISQGGEAVYLAGDVTDEVYASDLVALAVEQYGGLDIAFNNAGINGELGVDSDALSRAEWENTLTTNLTSAFLAAKYQLPQMLKRGAAQMLKRGAGSIIFTSSFVGYTIGFPQTAAYAASKAGMIGLTQSLAVEYGARGIRVNALLPGGTDTPMGREFANTPEAMAFVKNLHALKRLADPAEIAQSALYLASDAASFTTGIALLVDGGVSICKT